MMREFIFLVTFSILSLCSAYAHLHVMGLLQCSLGSLLQSHIWRLNYLRNSVVIEGFVLVFKIMLCYL